MLVIWSEWLAKYPCQERTRSTVKTTFPSLRLRVFINLRNLAYNLHTLHEDPDNPQPI